MSITIRQATPDDATAIYDMIYELAVYEKAPEEVGDDTRGDQRDTVCQRQQNRSADLRGGGQSGGLRGVLHQLPPPGLDAMVSIWRICTSPPTIAGSAPEKRC